MKPKVRDDLTVVELDGEAVIYDEETGELHHLNPSATIVFGLCDGTQTSDEMAGEISAAFEMPEDEVQAQVQQLVVQLGDVGLLQGVPRAEAPEEMAR